MSRNDASNGFSSSGSSFSRQSLLREPEAAVESYTGPRYRRNRDTSCLLGKDVKDVVTSVELRDQVSGVDGIAYIGVGEWLES